MLDLGLDDCDALFGREQRPFARVACNTDDQPVDNLSCAQNDVNVPVGDRIEGPRINSDVRRAHYFPPASPSPFSPVSARCATDTTRAPSSSVNTRTPPLPLRRMLISCTGVRITVPSLVTSIN